MSYEGIGKNREQKVFIERRSYLPPQLIYYGMVGNLTQAGGSPPNESAAMCTMGRAQNNNCTSDRIAKEKIVRIGNHPLGIGLYLFDYKPEFRDAWGHGRQFGVMADEVEKIIPEAVSVHPDGYKMVDYAMLGISRNLH